MITMANAGLLQISLIWIAYAVAVGCCFVVASVTTLTWQTPRERSIIVNVVAIISLTSLLATVLLLPVDIALVSATSSPALGAKKDWATPERVDQILRQLKIAYYSLYTLDALFCLLVIPFAYFWYEECDEVDLEEARRTPRARLLSAARYTLFIVALVLIIALLGIFMPTAGEPSRAFLDSDYFKKLAAITPGDKALTLTVGLLSTLGTILYIFYTSSGLALLPIAFVKKSPAASAPQLSSRTFSELEQNRERQRQLELRNNGRQTGINRKDRRELDALVREEQRLVRRERLAAEALGEGRSRMYQIWLQMCDFLSPIKIVGGFLMLAISLLVWISVLITAIDKAENSLCKYRCGYFLGKSHAFQPINWILVATAQFFPIDYVLMALLILYLFCSSIKGISSLGIRFLWIKLFQVRRGRTAPQALLIATVTLALIILAVNYAVVMLLASQYSTYGTQTFCTDQPKTPGGQPVCDVNSQMIRPCHETSANGRARAACTPSVMSEFLNRIAITWPVFGTLDFWAQFAFLAVFLTVLTVALFRTPQVNVAELDDDAEADEEESLLASTGRPFEAIRQDARGKIKRHHDADDTIAGFGATSSGV